MASATATVTGKTGPGATITALPLTGIDAVVFDFEHTMITFKYGDPARNFHVAWTAVTTVTFTISGGNAAIVVS